MNSALLRCLRLTAQPFHLTVKTTFTRVARSGAAMAAGLAWAACSIGNPPSTVHVEPDEAFKLAPGESVPVSNAALRIGFEGVTGDSRCRKGERCVWAGDAVVRVWLYLESGERETRDLHTATAATQAVTVLGRELRLVSLEPYPTAGKAIEQRDYVVTLRLGSVSAGNSDK